MELKKTKAFNLKVSLVAQGINVLLAIARTFIFTIFILPADFGIMAISYSVTGIIQLLRDFGYTTYIIQQKETSEEELNAINTRIFLLGC
ncbi:MAG TPA: oligosaccharide flippase family protein, partial [Puia sp.]|nr:oligosaccharide flippase family protein [Puia sp.]